MEQINPDLGGDIWGDAGIWRQPSANRRVRNFPLMVPDGKSIIFTKGPWYGQKVYKVSSTGGEPQEINISLKGGSPFVAYPSYSPDGRWIAFEGQPTKFMS